ncbi:hypothetical protein M527_07020 [Sphingobium indicum IP26]|uniref:tail completion protein gp17 n=1 Tax=Sphingobium TaxID=165695 RepID=UPI0003707588|nr:DUF3168 domain-containing protein [Sphingobium sp. HDIP04]EPR09872.1 hypothetical protein M527_07020 [Sphingobium indicum IP26]
MAAVLQLLTTDDAVLALVAVDNIMAGVLPQGTQLPGIGVAPVSSVDLQFIPDEARRFTSDRVQATVMARTFPELQAILKAVKSAGDGKRPIVAGIDGVSVRTDGQGPWFMDEAAAIHIQPQDFRVTYTQDA